MGKYDRKPGESGPGPIPGAEITSSLLVLSLLLLIVVCVVVGLGLVCTGSVPGG